MRLFAIAAFAVSAVVASPAAQAGPAWVGGGGVYIGAGYGHGGGRWAGGPYRPWYRPGYGYGGWRYGYPGYGFGYGLGYGLGYGFGWALAAGSPWYWGGPPVVYTVPSSMPFGYAAAPALAVEVQEPQTYVQHAPPQPAEQAGFWYYCTEPAGYHPYVQQCSRPWIAVNPQSMPAAAAP